MAIFNSDHRLLFLEQIKQIAQLFNVSVVFIKECER